MKTEYIKPFIQASRMVFKSLFCIDTEIGRVYMKPSPYFSNSVLIIIGVVGGFKGQIYFEMTEETAKAISNKMMGGMEFTEFNDICKSAVSEMGNMVMGNASTLFSKDEIHIDITPPTLITGQKIEISNKMAAVVVPFSLQELGVLNLNIAVEGEDI